MLLLLSMFEMALWYFDFVNFNASGFRPYGITLWAVIISTLRKSISRVLVLLVSMGFGVVRPTLGGLSRKVLIFTPLTLHKPSFFLLFSSCSFPRPGE